MDISVIIPSYNERESLPELIAWIDRVMQEHSFSYEILVIDDGVASEQPVPSKIKTNFTLFGIMENSSCVISSPVMTTPFNR